MRVASTFAACGALLPAMRHVCAAGTSVRRLQRFVAAVRFRLSTRSIDTSASGHRSPATETAHAFQGEAQQELLGFAEGVSSFLRLHEALVVRLLSPAVIGASGGQSAEQPAPRSVLEMLHRCRPLFENVACVARLCGAARVDGERAAVTVAELGSAGLLERLYSAATRASLLDATARAATATASATRSATKGAPADVPVAAHGGLVSPQRICEALFARAFEVAA